VSAHALSGLRQAPEPVHQSIELHHWLNNASLLRQLARCSDVHCLWLAFVLLLCHLCARLVRACDT
jgi:hypothetical protein